MPEPKKTARQSAVRSGPRNVTRADEIAAARRTRIATETRGQNHIAHRFAEEYQDRFMYVVGAGWYYWPVKDGTHWVLDGENKITRRAVVQLLKKMRIEGLDNKNIEQDVRACQNAGAQNGVLDIASTLPAFTQWFENLDQEVMKLNCLNGVLDLQDFSFTPGHDPGDLFTKCTNANYDPEARGQYWDRFLSSSLPDPEVRAFVQRYVGYSLMGKVKEHVLPIFKGLGRNGKGVFYKAVSDTLGSYSHHADASLFIAKKNSDDHSGPNPGLVALQGRRWITVSETNEGARLSTSTMKNLVGGEVITARNLWKGLVTFEPSHSIILVTNHLPKVEGDDPAVWERLKVVPWDVVIPKEKRNLNLDDDLRFERDVILAWAVEGLRMYWKIGLAPPTAVEGRTKEYRAESDTIRGWLTENCEEGPKFKTKLSEMVDAMNMGPHMKDDVIDGRVLARELRQRGIEVRNSTGKEQYVFGWRILDPARDST